MSRLRVSLILIVYTIHRIDQLHKVIGHFIVNYVCTARMSLVGPKGFVKLLQIHCYFHYSLDFYEFLNYANITNFNIKQ